MGHRWRGPELDSGFSHDHEHQRYRSDPQRLGLHGLTCLRSAGGGGAALEQLGRVQLSAYEWSEELRHLSIILESNLYGDDH